ncbi:MAG TPA: hypothetical protein VKB26_14285 [Candidatus Acidoferrales bacterium]|nr:hypothetical protein [Candidatus Acidoferrales bacterium]
MNSPPKGNRLGPDAIVMSGWTWEAFNVPERIALALAHLGSTVLYCENPVSLFRHKSRPRQEVESGVYRIGLEFLGHRLNRIPILMPRIQSKLLASQILRQAADVGLENPIFVYPHGDFSALCSEFKARGFSLVHVCMDYPETSQERLIELSDVTLVVPKSVYESMRQSYGDKVRVIPQVTRLFHSDDGHRESSSGVGELADVPHPRLGYVGPVNGRVDLPLLSKFLADHPQWQFLHFGAAKCFPFSNVHVLSWCAPGKLKAVVANLDVGFMPYARDDNKNLHCMPLKLFDYFSQGLPVVSTRIVNLLEFSDTIYFGDDPAELSHAIQLALDEPPDSPLKAKRMAIARKNSIEALASVLAEVLAPHGEAAYAPAI